MKPSLLVSCAAALVLTDIAAAATTGRAEAGLVVSRGNSETDTANARLELLNERPVWRNTFGIAGLYGRSNEATIATRWGAHAQSDRKFGNGAFWFMGLIYDDDRFSGFDYQATATTGLGREFINTAETLFKVQLGAGIRRLRPEQLVFDENDIVIDRIEGDPNSDLVGNAQVNYEHSFNGSTRFISRLAVEAGSSNTQSRGDFALQVKMTQLLAISVGVNVINNSNPPPLLKETDTLTTLNLVYERK